MRLVDLLATPRYLEPVQHEYDAMDRDEFNVTKYIVVVGEYGRWYV